MPARASDADAGRVRGRRRRRLAQAKPEPREPAHHLDRRPPPSTIGRPRHGRRRLTNAFPGPFDGHLAPGGVEPIAHSTLWLVLSAPAGAARRLRRGDGWRRRDHIPRLGIELPQPRRREPSPTQPDQRDLTNARRRRGR